MNDQINILVFGATGQIGQAALEQLSKYDHSHVSGVTRSPERVGLIDAHGAQAMIVDINDTASVKEAVKGIDSLLLMTGYSVDMLRQSVRVIDAAKAAGVRHVVHIGASGSPTAEIAHWDWHRSIEAYIERAGFTFTHLHPESFLQNLLSFGWLQPQAMLNLIGHARWSWVDARDVGALAGEALLGKDALKNRAIRMGYEAATMAELADQLEGLLDIKVELFETEPDAFYEAAIASGADPAYMSCVRDQLQLSRRGEIPEGDRTFDPNLFQDIVGRFPSRIADYITRESSRLISTQQTTVEA